MQAKMSKYDKTIINWFKEACMVKETDIYDGDIGQVTDLYKTNLSMKLETSRKSSGKN